MELLHKFFWLFKGEGIRYLIGAFGLPGICLIIFAETGIFPLLPGDSLLFVAGLYAATPGDGGVPVLALWQLLTFVPICGVIGDQIGYQIGLRAGEKVYQWKEKSLWIIPIYRPSYLVKTKEFFDRWGVFAVIASRWVPIVRTFAPVLAGVVRMPYKTFVPFNIIGAFTWVWSMTLLGYFAPPVVKQIFPNFDLEANIEKIILVIIFLSVLPIVWAYFNDRKSSAKRVLRSESSTKTKRVSPNGRKIK